MFSTERTIPKRSAAVPTPTTAATADRIYDFSFAEGDRIDLAPVDANFIFSGNQAFDFIGTQAFTHTAGELRYTQSGG